jgi:hypothetical protein
VSVIVLLGDFGAHFAPKAAEDERQRLVQEILADRIPRAFPADQAISGLHSGARIRRIEANHS